MQEPVYEPLSGDDPRVIGGYRIVARLGAGGMGRVYLATTQSGRRLAIKVVRPEFADDPEFRRRFAQEVAAAQRVQNLYTAPVIDADLTGAAPWLATAVHESGPLPPATLRVLAAGGPRVIDFGIARAADATPLTRASGLVGSPQFMAPEQIRGAEPAPALDVFAFGALLFFAATGRSAFGDGPAQAVMYRIVQEEPRLDGCPPSSRPSSGAAWRRTPPTGPPRSGFSTSSPTVRPRRPRNGCPTGSPTWCTATTTTRPRRPSPRPRVPIPSAPSPPRHGGRTPTPHRDIPRPSEASGGVSCSWIDAGRTGDYATCHADTRYITGGLTSASRGSLRCVYTKSGLLGVITIKDIDDDYLTIDLKVWQGPAD